MTPFGDDIGWPDPVTGEIVPGYNPDLIDASGEFVGEPTGQTLAALFFDHDDDGDADLWLADDGSRLKVFRNDSTETDIKFTQISRAMGVDMMGAWMGFALGDYDNDLDLDVFVTNIGYHPLTREASDHAFRRLRVWTSVRMGNLLPLFATQRRRSRR